ncbi:MAG: Asp-tRNA(Asn)/Glu-tRNA(Gln) amidotransferase subunit GatC [Armatimonadota bacterium]|jgi:aspartyl-tRNA(Asn)/glutamyl-tRNA(Gln) amidotransferase subunit C
MDRITREEVEHVAWLARLALDDEELERLGRELNRILEAFTELQQLDTEDVEPTSHAVPMSNVFREDAVGESLPREDVLANAPDRTDTCFRVPLIIEELF